MRTTSPDAPSLNPSQTSANSGPSRRVVSNGEQVVLNSDSDTDSLPDLDFGEATIKPKRSTTATTTTCLKRTPEEEHYGIRQPIKKRRTNFDALVATAQKNMEAERRIREQKAELDKPLDKSLEEATTVNITINEETLGQFLQDHDDDPEKARRLFQAMQRTNATQMETTFHIFQDTSDSMPVPTNFPINSLPKHRWVANFEDSTSRDQAFLTGFAHQIFRLKELPGELASWMIEQICYSRNETLNVKYLDILESHHEHLQSTSKKLLPPSLKSVAKLLERAAPWLRAKARSHALYILCHVCLDDRVNADANVLGIIQDAIEAVICNFADNHRLSSGVGSPPSKQHFQSLIASQLSETIPQLLANITDPLLQRNLICAFPARSPLTAYLQRHLALSFLVHPTTIDVPLADPKLPGIIHMHLNNSPAFRIIKGTDYDRLTARLTLLDIAVGPGPLTVPYQPLLNPATSQAGFSPITAPFPGSSDVRSFNKEVDALAQHVKILSNSISEAGAVVDLRILDVKDTMERLCSRLEHAVRIGGKKVHNVFGDDEVQKQFKVSKFFKKAEIPVRSPGIFDDEEDDN
ncbi:hypothetical protein EJ02DRAFT_265217 [Clathrospora elynae]|uniref:Uncharacterized protein n=1 Tax=Clathrospora elynae TaxID=706981 RepID=A0A6A5SID7_9PLEO|nr:hypothetical protein EJ02DRAFT_265217 [Clathrospora elynae]